MKLLTVEQVASEDWLACSRATIQRLISEGSLPAICLRRGKRKAVYRVRQEALEKWILNKEKQNGKGEKHE